MAHKFTTTAGRPHDKAKKLSRGTRLHRGWGMLMEEYMICLHPDSPLQCTRLYVRYDVHRTAVQIEDYEIWASCIVPHGFIWS